MYKFSLLLIFLNLLAHYSQGHNGSIIGAVYDKDTNLPLVGANIIILDTDKSISSDILGTFQFSNLIAKSYILKVTYLGYESSMVTVAVKDGETTTIAAYLPTTHFELSEVIISSGIANKINTISSIDIKQRPTNSAQDILRIIPGLFIAQHAGGGKAEQIFLRGFDIDHGTDIDISVDGMPVNMVSHAHGQGYADLHFLIPETVEVADFDKGPYYAGKGDFATAGFVAFQTKNALNKSLIKLEAGQFNTYRAVSMLDLLGKKARSRNQSAYIASEYLFSDGYFDSPQNLNRLNLFAKYNQYIDDNKILNISLSTFSSSWDASGQIPQRAIDAGLIGRFGAIDNTEGGSTRRTNANLQLTTLLPDGAMLKNQLYLTNYQFELYSNFTFFLADSINGDQIRQKENRNLAGYLTTYTRQDNIFNRELRTELGAGIRYDQINESELSRTKNRRITTDQIALGDIGQLNAHVYLDEHLQISPRLVLNVGLRLDAMNFAYTDHLDTLFKKESVAKHILSPKVNLHYELNKKIRFTLNTGIGFHSNHARVVVLQRGQDILPKAYGSEIGALIKPSNKLLLSGSLWHLDMDQEFIYVGDEGIVEPGGKSRRYGVDFSLRYQLLEWLFADTDVNLSKPRFLGVEEGNNLIPLAPAFTSIGGLSFRLKNGLNGSLRYRYLSDRPANEDNTVIAKGYLLADAVLKYTKSKYEVALTAENLTNTKWKEAQFDTESRLSFESGPISEIHFTPGTPFFLKASWSYFF